uniref:15-oxoprostaglandin 13-reductase n=1 Tax=Heterorhabditis bacteriophora TaxID=37862 RepID=A0A1I7XU10_HETBA
MSLARYKSSEINMDEGTSHGNERIVFVKRPGENAPPLVECFQCEPCHDPTESDVGRGQCLISTLFLSVDPAQRCRMNCSTGVDYLASYEPGELVDGLEGVGIVEVAGEGCLLSVGDIVTSCALLWPWTKRFIADSNDLVKVNLPVGFSPSVILSCVGISGMTALLGIRKKAAIDRSRPQTIVISGAAGSCGTLAGQIARIEGCSLIIGICGSEDKCRFLVSESLLLYIVVWFLKCYFFNQTSELNFDGAINYRAEAVGERLDQLAPDGVDIYFDNVGGFVSDAVIQKKNIFSKMNEGGRIVLCGQIAVYNTDLPYPPPIPPKTAEIICSRKIQRERFLVFAYREEMDGAVAQLSQWLQQKKIKVNETIYEGLSNAPQAFVDMMAGKNIGKMIIRV